MIRFFWSEISKGEKRNLLVLDQEERNGDVRVGVTGAGSSGVFRHPGLEAALSANWSPDAVANVTVDASDLLTDLHASAAYRANLVRVMTKRAVAAA